MPHSLFPPVHRFSPRLILGWLYVYTAELDVLASLCPSALIGDDLDHHHLPHQADSTRPRLAVPIPFQHMQRRLELLSTGQSQAKTRSCSLHFASEARTAHTYLVSSSSSSSNSQLADPMVLTSRTYQCALVYILFVLVSCRYMRNCHRH